METEPATSLLFMRNPVGLFRLWGYFMYQYPKQRLTIAQQVQSVIIIGLFIAFFCIADNPIDSLQLERGEVRLVTNEGCVVKVDSVRHRADGLTILVRNAGICNVDLSVHGSDRDGLYFEPAKLEKLDVYGDWMEVPVLEDACVEADCLPLKPDMTACADITWESWYGENLSSGTYRLTSLFTYTEGVDCGKDDEFVIEFGW